MSAITTTIAVAVGSGAVAELLARRFSKPLIRLLLPLALTAAASMAGVPVKIPSWVGLALAVVLGVYFGLQIDRKAIGRIRELLLPSVVMIGWYLALTPAFGIALSRLTFLTRTTALLAVIPGGIEGTSLLAMAYDADLSIVTSFQTARFFSIVLITPILANLRTGRKTEKTGRRVSTAERTRQSGFPRWLLFFAAGSLGAALLALVRLPAGALIGALVATSVTGVVSGDRLGKPPPSLYNLAQIGLGITVGASFTADSAHAVVGLIGPVLLFTTLVLVTSSILAAILHSAFGWSYLTALLAVMPGGLTMMLLLARQLDEDLTVVSTTQTLRKLTAILLVPLLYSWLV